MSKTDAVDNLNNSELDDGSYKLLLIECGLWYKQNAY